MSEQKLLFYIGTTDQDMGALFKKLIRQFMPQGWLVVGLPFTQDAQHDEWVFNQRCIEMADVCLFITAQNYGPLSHTGVGFVHRAHAHALAMKKPVMVAYQAINNTPVNDDELRLKGFLRQLGAGPHFEWRSEFDLTSLLKRQLESWVPMLQLDPLVRASAQNVAVDATAIKPKVNERPVPNENLVNGADSFNVDYRCKVFIDGNVSLVKQQYNTNWNGVLQLLAPALTASPKENEIKAAFEDRLAARVESALRRKYPKAHAFVEHRVDVSAFDQVKAQALALGWAELDEGRWTLTRQGKFEWQRLAALVKQ